MSKPERRTGWFKVPNAIVDDGLLLPVDPAGEHQDEEHDQVDKNRARINVIHLRAEEGDPSPGGTVTAAPRRLN